MDKKCNYCGSDNFTKAKLSTSFGSVMSLKENNKTSFNKKAQPYIVKFTLTAGQLIEYIYKEKNKRQSTGIDCLLYGTLYFGKVF